MNTLAKTRRRVVDISGGFPGMISDRSDNFLKFLVSNAEDAFTRPWHRLERGMRMNRLRKFVDDEAERFNFTEDDKTQMFMTLTKALDKKQLNSKSIVNYDQEQQKILEIKGFVFHKQADGSMKFQFTERKTGTVRRRTSSPLTSTVTTQEPKQPAQNIQQE